MKASSTSRHFLLPLALVSIAAVSMTTILAAISLRNLNVSSGSSSLLQGTRALANLAVPLMLDHASSDSILGIVAIRNFCSTAAQDNRLRVTIIALDGTVLGDSQADAGSMENHALRSEVAAALSGREGLELRKSSTIGVELYYAAVPIRSGNKLLGVLRLALEPPQLGTRLMPFYLGAILSAILVSLAAVYASIKLASRLSKPVNALISAAQAWSAGQLDYRMTSLHDSELAILPAAMNSMAGELQQRIASMNEARRELEVLLDCMAEAVMATDHNLNMRTINSEACRLFGRDTADPASLAGRSLLEVSSQAGLEAIALACLQKAATIEEEFILYGETTRSFIAYASPVLWQNRAAGVVIVLNDITRLKQLEKIRRDFVANVSHELRTPITLIKGFVETLEAGAIDRADDARRFLGIINRNTDRMSSVIQDLLALAQLESPERHQLEKTTIQVKHLFNAVTAQLIDKAKGRNILIQTSCDQKLEVFGNEGLLEQALINLLDNAIKYGRPDSTILMKAEIEEQHLVLSVQDKGMGIPARSVPRIFERFFRVDQARSRELGGTGLGLSIVKHIALAHNGTVQVESAEGKGSIFSICLPLPGSDQCCPTQVSEASKELGMD